MRISDWSSDVCSSDLAGFVREGITPAGMSSAYRVLPAMDHVASGCSTAVGIATFATLVFRATTGGALHAVPHATRVRDTATVAVELPPRATRVDFVGR